MNGAIPSADADTYNQYLTIAYTAYDKDHKGSIKVCNFKERPKVIIKIRIKQSILTES